MYGKQRSDDMCQIADTPGRLKMYSTICATQSCVSMVVDTSNILYWKMNGINCIKDWQIAVIDLVSH